MKFKFLREKMLEADKGGATGGSSDDVKDKDQKDNAGSGSSEKEDKDDESQKDEKKSYSDEELEKLLSSKSKEGKAEMLKALGFKSEEEASAAIKKYQEWLDSQKTDEEKRKEKENQTNAELAEAKKTAEIAEAKVEALKLGAKPDSVDDVISLAISKKSEDGDFKTVIAEIKKKYSNMFEASTDEDDKDGKKKKAGQKGTGGNINNRIKDNNKDEPKSLGQRLAASRRSNKKSSFFSN